MKRKIIRIENSIVTVPKSGEISMTASEIASLFDVYVREIYNHAKAIMKSGVIHVDVSVPLIVIGNTVMPDVYGLEMIVALAFRIKSQKAEVFRKWLIRKMVENTFGQQILMSIMWNDKALLN
jgi:hypothetical protein